jgi:hypothetical protein
MRRYLDADFANDMPDEVRHPTTRRHNAEVMSPFVVCLVYIRLMVPCSPDTSTAWRQFSLHSIYHFHLCYMRGFGKFGHSVEFGYIHMTIDVRFIELKNAGIETINELFHSLLLWLLFDMTWSLHRVFDLRLTNRLATTYSPQEAGF